MMNEQQQTQPAETGQQQKRSLLRKGGSVAWRIVMPFSAMKKTASLAANEAQRHRENISYIREMAQTVRESLLKTDAQSRDQSFDDAMHNRSPDALGEADLYRYFLGRKRVCHTAMLFFLVLGVLGVLNGVSTDTPRVVAFSLLSIVAAMPLFFVLAMSAHLRLWQLTTHRLSHEERGGLQDWMREPGWWATVLDPEIGRKPHPHTADSTETEHE